MVWLVLFGLFFLGAFSLIIGLSVRTFQNARSRETMNDDRAIAANYERVQREMANTVYGEMGPNELAQAYREHLRGIRVRNAGWMFLITGVVAVAPGVVLGFDMAIFLTSLLAGFLISLLIVGFASGLSHPKWPVK